MNKTMLSIVVPVYNVEKYIKECIDSILEQMSEEIEVILIDDGSTDSSSEYCDIISTQNKFVTVVHKENGGLSDARNVGIKKAKGKYIMFLDSDDKLTKGILPMLIDKIRGEQSDIIMGRVKTFSKENKHGTYNIDSYSSYKRYSNPSKVLLKLDKRSDFWFTANIIIAKKTFIENNKLYFRRGFFHEDELWVPMVFGVAKTVILTDAVFYYYRVDREGSIVSTPTIKREFDIISIACLLRNKKCKKRITEKLYKRRAAALCYGALLYLYDYRFDSRYYELEKKIQKNVSIMMYGKYISVGVMCLVFGVKRVSKLLSVKKMKEG